MKIEISKIIIPSGRRPVKDINSLADSIREIGLMNPITLKSNHELVAGLHRLEACKLLGWQLIPANIIELDGLKAELAEIDENLIRNEYSVLERGEKLTRRKEIYEILHPETKQGGDRKSEEIKSKRNNFALKNSFADDTAKKTGVTPRTVQQEIQIASKINKEVKEVIRDTPLADSKTELLKIARLKPEEQKEVVGKVVTGEVKTIREAQRQVKHENLPTIKIPEDKFNVILSDPPWRYDFAETKSRDIENKYPTMDIEEIKTLKIPSANNAVLFLWATAPKLLEALDVMKAWGFTYKTHGIWDKEKIGMGYWFRGQHELLLVGTKGQFSPPAPENRPSSIIKYPRGEHSKKPEIVYEILEKMFPKQQFLEIFARNERMNWISWGNQM